MSKRFFIIMVIMVSTIFVSIGFSQTKGKVQTNMSSVKTNVSDVKTNISTSTTEVVTEVGSKDLPVEVEVKTSSPEGVLEKKEGIEYIQVYEKEKGIRVYLEAGGGPLISGGVIWRITPIFGIGIGGGYTPLPYRNFGPVLDLRAEVVPIYFFVAGDEVKMNVIGGLRGVFFFGSMSQYLGADVGSEFLIKRFQYLIPSIHIYLYLGGNIIIPQISFQIRGTF